MITEDLLKSYQARVAALKADIKKHPNLWQLKDDLRVYEALVRRAKIELGWPVCRDSGCNVDVIFEVENGEWACTRHGGWPPANRKHPVAIHLPRLCPYDEVKMENTERLNVPSVDTKFSILSLQPRPTKVVNHCLHPIATALTALSNAGPSLPKSESTLGSVLCQWTL